MQEPDSEPLVLNPQDNRIPKKRTLNPVPTLAVASAIAFRP